MTAGPDLLERLVLEAPDHGDPRPVAVVFMCSDERFDCPGGRRDQIKFYWEALGYKVYFVRLPATVNWMADSRFGPFIMFICRVFLEMASVIVLEAHMDCVGVRAKAKQLNHPPLQDSKERAVHLEDLPTAMHAVSAELRKLDHHATVYTYVAVIATEEQYADEQDLMQA